MAGSGAGISNALISLEIASPDVPDLTLIDLPGITRVAVEGQPEDIGDRVYWFMSTLIQSKIPSPFFLKMIRKCITPLMVMI